MAENNFSYNDNYYYFHFAEQIKNKYIYNLLSEYWREVLFLRNRIEASAFVLDYGCGIGQISAALNNVTYFDTSEFAINLLRQYGKNVLNSVADIPRERFDYILSFHSLEHIHNPAEILKSFHGYLKKEGKLILVVPLEGGYLKNSRLTLQPDYLNKHLYCWTPQTIVNLLVYCGWGPGYQVKINGPFLLRTLGKKIPKKYAVKIAYHLGRLVNNYPSLLTICKSGI